MGELCESLYDNKFSKVKRILKAKPSLANELDESGDLPLFCVRRASIARLLLEHGADVNARGDL